MRSFGHEYSFFFTALLHSAIWRIASGEPGCSGVVFNLLWTPSVRPTVPHVNVRTPFSGTSTC